MVSIVRFTETRDRVGLHLIILPVVMNFKAQGNLTNVLWKWIFKGKGYVGGEYSGASLMCIECSIP